MRRYFNFLLAIPVIAFGFSACLNTNAPATSSNANVTAFSVKTMAGVSYSFSIDTTTCIITNTDSLPYLTSPDSLVPSISGSYLSSIKIVCKLADKDTTFDYNASALDTISFADSVKIVTIAEDGKTSKTFKVVVNIHQQDPDLYTWLPRQTIYSENATAEKLVVLDTAQLLYLKVGSVVKLYVCKDEQHWNLENLSGFPNDFDIKYIFKSGEKLFIAKNNKIFSSADGIAWAEEATTTQSVDNLLFALNGDIFGITKSDLKLYKFSANDWVEIKVLPDEFPVLGEAICITQGTSGNPRAFFVGGEDKDGNLLSSVWATQNGTYWVNLGATGSWFSPRRDACVVQYDNSVLMLGGNDAGGLIISDFFYVSPNFGLSWRLPNANMVSNDDIFVPRANLQAALNKEKTKIYFVGGQQGNGTFVKDAWVVMKNSVLWEIQQ